MHTHSPIFTLAACLVLSLGAATLQAQEKPSRHAVPGHRYLKEYWNQSELYLEHQAWYMLDLADRALDENPPAVTTNLSRRMALLLVDAVTHEPAPIDNPAVLDFLGRRMQRVIDDLDRPLRGRKSLRIYKLYNCGIIFRTRDLTVAVDLNGREGRLIPDEKMAQIVSKVDILFCTHNHSDHIDSHVRDMCHKEGIPIYATAEIFRDDPEVHHVRYEEPRRIGIDLPAGHLEVDVLPGHQDDVQNNIWIVTLPNGRVVGATGDQWKNEGKDLQWLRDIHTRLPRIDVLAMDCWIHDFDAHVAAFRPRLLVSQHENEIGAHGIDHRESYWMSLYKSEHFREDSTPCVLMTWGEWFDFR